VRERADRDLEADAATCSESSAGRKLGMNSRSSNRTLGPGGTDPPCRNLRVLALAPRRQREKLCSESLRNLPTSDGIEFALAANRD
jgi:hypothetical protein